MSDETFIFICLSLILFYLYVNNIEIPHKIIEYVKKKRQQYKISQ